MATTQRPLETYMTPSTTSGTDDPPPPIGNVHACCSLATLPGLIWVSGEKRVAPGSRLMLTQSPGAICVGLLPCAQVATTSVATAATMTRRRNVVLTSIWIWALGSGIWDFLFLRQREHHVLTRQSRRTATASTAATRAAGGR